MDAPMVFPLDPELVEVLREAEKQLDLGDGFFGRLDEYDDWTLVIVSGTLIDTKIHRLLVSALAPGGASEEVDRFLWKEMQARKRREFAARLGLLSESDVRLASFIAQVRNYAAHDFKAINGFSIPRYFERLDPKEREKLAMDVFPSEAGAASVDRDNWHPFGRPYLVVRVKLLIAGISKRESLETQKKLNEDFVRIVGDRT
jgi:hypothetical protein